MIKLLERMDIIDTEDIARSLFNLGTVLMVFPLVIAGFVVLLNASA